MAEKLYYDDNIFYLNEIITTIDDAVQLDIDSDLFSDKMVDDILFVESTLARLYGSLSENELLIRRTEHLRRILRSKQKFTELLEGIVQQRVTIASELVPFFPKFRELVYEQQRHIEEIRSMLNTTAASVDRNEDMVSPEEYRILMEDGSEETV
ncbi:MAG: hypothetical protein HN368_00120 [Spirochaetales bacterium]|jgi:hypothetical protein|nr:hypothetical protein [Spirochaetales bacterium]